MSQIATVRIETKSGVTEVPVFEPGDSNPTVLEAWRIKTETGTGFIPLTDPAQAAFPFLRVQTEQGVFSVTDTVGAPNSVKHQYRAQNFTTSTWTDTAPNGPQADMSINGVSASTLNGDRSASSDGVDDFAVSDGPQTLPEQKQFGIAFVFRSSDTTDGSRWFGVSDSNTGAIFNIEDSDTFTGETGNLILRTKGGSGDLLVETADQFVDGDVHLVVINKIANSGSGAVEFYVDGQQVNSTVQIDSGFDHTNYSMNRDMHFFGRNQVNGSGARDFKALDMPFIEFNEEPYSSTERQNLKQRAPGL
jgi:hypothetical protein